MLKSLEKTVNLIVHSLTTSSDGSLQFSGILFFRFGNVVRVQKLVFYPINRCRFVLVRREGAMA